MARKNYNFSKRFAYLDCFNCGEITQRTSTFQKYCKSCREKLILERRRINAKKRWNDPVIHERLKNENRISGRLYREKNRDKILLKMKEKRKRERLQVIKYYGNKCQCCGESRYEFLAIDHINGGGNKHRKKLKMASIKPEWFIKNNFPKDFRILCHNCNMANAYYGKCPHQL